MLNNRAGGAIPVAVSAPTTSTNAPAAEYAPTRIRRRSNRSADRPAGEHCDATGSVAVACTSATTDGAAPAAGSIQLTEASCAHAITFATSQVPNNRPNAWLGKGEGGEPSTVGDAVGL
jgi:hypothetical protein